MSSPDVLAGARQAASIIALRDRAGGGIEVLMLRRAEREGDPWSGAAVFPGGVLSAHDGLAHPFVLGWNDTDASARLGVPSGGLDYFVAAARECFEEVGLLFAHAPTRAALARAHAEWRAPLQRGEQPLAAMCEALRLRLDLRDWAFVSHWLTPLGTARRFDTRFFVARAPANQVAVADQGEAQSVMWLAPADAIAPATGLKLVPVTREVLRLLVRFESVEAALSYARALPDVRRILPRRSRTAEGASVVLPGDAAYDEIAHLDPTGRGQAFSDLTADRVVHLSPRLLRITAPNAGVMTGPGTNTYLVGDPETNRWTVIDPGPDDAAHLEAVERAAPGPIERILVTHTHPDHSPGAARLAEATRAPVLGQRTHHREHQDASFAPNAELRGGEQIALGAATTLRVVHTPGHASNHLCFLLVEEHTLLSGDHVMQGGTVIIDPPDGDMAAYFQSLETVSALDVAWIAPGRGLLMPARARWWRRCCATAASARRRWRTRCGASRRPCWGNSCWTRTPTRRSRFIPSRCARCWRTCSSSRAKGGRVWRARRGRAHRDADPPRAREHAASQARYVPRCGHVAPAAGHLRAIDPRPRRPNTPPTLQVVRHRVLERAAGRNATGAPVSAPLEQLVPGRRQFDGADPIFRMNAAAQQRAATGASVINATVGALLDDAGKLVVLDTVMAQYRQLTPLEIAPYAPIAGDPAYVLALTRRHWPGLASYGMGAATPGGSGALALSLRNLLEPGQRLLTAAPFWGPYATIALENRVKLDTVPFPTTGTALDVGAWRTRAEEILREQGRLLLWLNDPCHNPTGRSLSTPDRRALLAMLRDLSPLGPVTLMLDLAYLDYARDGATVRAALDDYEAFGAEGRVLVGASLSLSKAFTLYGSRGGALVFPWCTDAALGAALSVSCRGTYSNCARAPMSVLNRLAADPQALASLAAEHARWSAVLTERADALDAALRAEGLPGASWDGGFFVMLEVAEPTAVTERLMAENVFVVPIPEGLRVGVCGIKVSDAPRFAAAFRKCR